MNQENLKTQLQDILTHKPGSIQAKVAQEALERDNPKDFFEELTQYGCISGMVSSLIYYCDTHAFYEEHYDEIEELRSEYEDNFGEPLKIKDDLKNFLAWFAFEETAYRLSLEFGIV